MVGDSMFSGGDEVHVVLPPFSTYLRTARLLAADAATRAGLDCVATEDFRLAVDELCQAAMRATDQLIFISFESTPGRVVARGAGHTRDGCTLELSDLSATIIDALSDGFEFELCGSDLTFSVHRRCAVLHHG